MTRAALDTQINTQITTAPATANSIPKTVVGGNMNDMLDYVDHQIAMKCVKVTISSAQILTTLLANTTAANPLGYAVDGYIQVGLMSPIYNYNGSIRNNSYLLKGNSSNPTSGDGDIDVYITYYEITL
jgi:hypothetical protein